MTWAERYARGFTPWDMGRAHPELARRLAEGALVAEGDRRALVPGCGKGHDALLLAKSGFEVTALDIVEALAASVGPALEAHGGRFLLADALAYREPHALLFEHTFFCALEPEERARYGEMAAACLAPGGVLHAVVFPVDKPREQGGPPFAMTTDDLADALGAAFESIEDSPIAPIEGRPWAARWASFRRR